MERMDLLGRSSLTEVGQTASFSFLNANVTIDVSSPYSDSTASIRVSYHLLVPLGRGRHYLCSNLWSRLPADMFVSFCDLSFKATQPGSPFSLDPLCLVFPPILKGPCPHGNLTNRIHLDFTTSPTTGYLPLS